MKSITKISILIFVHFSIALMATDLTISQPGIYVIGSNLISTPGGATNIINITSSDVVLDLGGYVIAQGNSTASVDGITINANLNDIVIRNGTIRNTTGSGIIVGAGNSKVRIINIVFENCGTTGLAADGTGNIITDLEVLQCRFYGCCSNATGQNVFNCTFVNRVLVNDCIVAGTANSAATFRCFNFTSCSMCSVSNIIIQNNTNSGGSSTFIGLLDSSTGNSTFSNITIRNNSSTPGGAGTFNAVSSLSTSSANVYTNCLVVSNTTNGTFNGFSVTASSDIFQQCTVMQCSGVPINGFLDSTGNSCIYTDCIASGLTSATSTAIGFNLNETNDIVARAIGTRMNTAAAATVSAGFATNTTNSFITIFDSLFSVNTGGTIGIGASDGSVVNSHNLYYRNVAFANTSAQFSGAGFSQTAPAAPATQNIAAVSVPWTNLAVAA